MGFVFVAQPLVFLNEVHEEWRNRLAKSGGTILAGGEQCSGDSDRSCAATLFAWWWHLGCLKRTWFLRRLLFGWWFHLLCLFLLFNLYTLVNLHAFTGAFLFFITHSSPQTFWRSRLNGLIFRQEKTVIFGRRKKTFWPSIRLGVEWCRKNHENNPYLCANPR